MTVENALMLDIETMGVSEAAPIVSIGACIFDSLSLAIPDDSARFYATVSLKSNASAGRVIDPGTVEWWLKQSPEAQRALFDEPHTNLKNALVQLRMWAQDIEPKICTVWANDPDFDVVILRNACQAVGEMWPWPFWMNRSVRTIKHYAWPEGEPSVVRDGVHHRAVDDAVHQAKLVQIGLDRIRQGRVYEP